MRSLLRERGLKGITGGSFIVAPGGAVKCLH